MPLTVAAVSPLLVSNTGASLRGLVPSGGYPSRLRSLCSLRGPLARRFAALTAACLSAAAAPCSGALVLPPPSPPRAGAERRARRRLRLACPCRLRRPRPAPRLGAARPDGCHLARPLDSPAFAFANTALRAAASRPARSRAAAAPSGSDSGTVLPDVQYPGLGLLYALRRLGSHTPRIDSAFPIGDES